MNTKDQLLDHLPFYHTGENIQNFIAIVASLFDEVKDQEKSIKDSHNLDNASGINLDRTVNNVGITRDVVKFIEEKIDIDVEKENDIMLQNRTKWNIDLQQSKGVEEDIKNLITRGLIMYRVRTGLGGKVFKDLVEATNFSSKLPPKFEIPDEINIENQRYLEPNDIYIFPNEETRLGMKAPDSQHGKYGNLSNFYEIELPWKALPWSEGENSLRWSSQDNFEKPYYSTFTKDSLDGNTLTINHELENDYPVVSAVDGNGVYHNLSDILASDNSLEIDLSNYTIDGEWGIRLTGVGFFRVFDSDDLSNGVFTFKHNIEESYPPIALYDNNDKKVNLQNIMVEYVSDYKISIDLSNVNVDGMWKVTVAGGTNSVAHVEKFGDEDLGG